jgi:phosphotransferase system enzyme I (PtsI)
MRAIRLSLDRPGALRTQLRALVRAARYGRIRVLLPFVTSVGEVRRAREELQAARAAVSAADGLDPDVPLGAMIEVPAAALTTDLLADEVAFLSVGTNDLVQYCLAVDRSDGRMAGLYEPLHPAILRVIRFVLTAARSRHRTVSVCGEMAGDPASLAVLLGLGVRALSMNPASISGARALIGQMTLRESWDLARAALRKRTGHDVAALVADALARFRGREGPAGVNGGRDRE